MTVYSFDTRYDPWGWDTEDPFDEDYERENYSSDERFGPERQAERELTREMNKYAAADYDGVEWGTAVCNPIRLKEEGIHPDAWFSPWDSTAAAKAAADCFQCPVRLQCLKYACDAKEADGIWGGLPDRIRTGFTREHSAHNFDELSKLENPYETDRGPYAPFNLRDWTPGIDDEYIAPAIPEGTPIPGYSDYVATPDGHIWKISTGVRCKYNFQSGGEHLYVYLRNSESQVRRKVSQIIAATFLGYPLESGYAVHHENGDVTDFRVSNLRWEPTPIKVENPKPVKYKLTKEQRAEMVRENIEDGVSQKELAEKYGVSSSTVHHHIKAWKDKHQ